MKINSSIIKPICLPALLVLLFTGCQKESELDIPAYIAIDSISLDPGQVTGEQGTSSSKIVDAWVYTDQDLEGAFELPALFPVLKAGPTILHIQPGIKINGMSETRAPYPFYDTISLAVNLSRANDVEAGHLRTRYKSSAVFGWIEDFEDTHVSLDTTNNNNVLLRRTGEPSLAEAFQGESNQYAGKIQITSDSDFFEYVSHNTFEYIQNLPEEKSAVFLELNYKSNAPFTAGMILYGDQTLRQPVVVINKSEKWNKIYINLTPSLLSNYNADSYKVYFSASKEESGDDVTIYIDNIKLLHF